MFSKEQNQLAAEQAIQDSVADNYEQLRYKLPYAQAYHAWWVREMLDLASLSPGAKNKNMVLDNGCGTGFILKELGGSEGIIGLDLSAKMLAKAYLINNRVVQGNSCHLPVADNLFDLIFARALIHHLPNPEEGLKEMARVLKPQGQVVLADTNNSILSNLPRHIAYRSRNFSDHHINLKHQDYLIWIEKYFHIKQVRFFGYFAYPFGFPDMMGKFRHIRYPVKLVHFLIQIDKLISHVPVVKKQSWGIIVSASKL